MTKFRSVPLWVFLVSLLIWAFFTVAFGWAIKSTMSGSNLSGALGKAAVEIASIPTIVKEFSLNVFNMSSGEDKSTSVGATIASHQVNPDLVAQDFLRAEKVYEGDAMLSNLGFVPESGEIAVLEQKTGSVILVPPGEAPRKILDISERMKSPPVPSEQGLLGIAFPPDFRASRTVYLAYTNRFNQWTVSRIELGDASSDAYQEHVLLEVDRYSAVHACGQIEFHPIDGYLYACLGDSDVQGAPNATASNLELLHGKIIRIDATTPSTGYLVPDDNPLRNVTGARPEIWVSGLRNPWLFAFDGETGDAFIPDVGWNAFEEINFLPYSGKAGADFGWPRFEAEIPLQAAAEARCSPRTCTEQPLVGPILSYTHASGCAAIGGAVYRGTAFPDLDGVYFFSDFCSSVLWALRLGRSGLWEFAAVGELPVNPSAIKSAPDGSIYVAGGTEVWKLDLADIDNVQWTAIRPFERHPLEFSNLNELPDFISNNPESTVILAVKDEATRGLSDTTKRALSKVGINLGNLEFRGSYASVISHGTVVEQQTNNNGSVTLESDALRGLGIDSVFSAGHTFGGSAAIVIDGFDRSWNHRGINVIILEDGGARVGYVDSHQTESVTTLPR